MMHIGDDAQSVFAAVTRALFRREPRLPDDADGIEFKVDGVEMTARPDGMRSVRLSCVLAPSLPDDSKLRALMSRFLGQCEDSDAVLCADATERLLLVTNIEFGQEIAARVTDFCNTAIYWHKQATQRPSERPVERMPVMIFP